MSPSSEIDLHAFADRMKCAQQYTGHQTFVNRYGWFPSNNHGHILVRKSDIAKISPNALRVADKEGLLTDQAYRIINFGVVASDDCALDPIGTEKFKSTNSKFVKPLEKARTYFRLDPAGNSILGDLGTDGFNGLEAICSTMGKTDGRPHFMDKGGVRFSHNLFRPSSETCDSYDNYPVPEHYEDQFAALRGKFALDAFPLFDEHGQMVAPQDVQHAMAGALVEVHYQLRYHWISSRSEDSFTGKVMQVRILKRNWVVERRVASKSFVLNQNLDSEDVQSTSSATLSASPADEGNAAGPNLAAPVNDSPPDAQTDHVESTNEGKVGLKRGQDVLGKAETGSPSKKANTRSSAR